MKKFILGKKQGMSQLFGEDGRVTPVTVIEVPPNFVTQVKNKKTDGYDAVQLGIGETTKKHLTKPQQGHVKDLPLVKTLKEFKPEEIEGYKRGDKISVDIFESGEKVKISGVSYGKGFQGVVKRHGFSGGPASHGHRHVLRTPGSIGSRFPQRVLKGMRMAGRMGHDRVTVRNVIVMRVDKENNSLFLRGSVPGKKGTVIEIVS